MSTSCATPALRWSSVPTEARFATRSDLVKGITRCVLRALDAEHRYSQDPSKLNADLVITEANNLRHALAKRVTVLRGRHYFGTCP